MIHHLFIIIHVREKQKVQLNRDNSETQTRTKHKTQHMLSNMGPDQTPGANGSALQW